MKNEAKKVDVVKENSSTEWEWLGFFTSLPSRDPCLMLGIRVLMEIDRSILFLFSSSAI